MNAGNPNPAPARSSSYVLLIFWIISMFSFLDRQVLSALLEPIKAEFHLNDQQLGLLSGPAFGLFYALFGFPLAMLVDRFNRSRLLVAAISLWSLMTMACGAAGNFSTLFLARSGVAVGEAGGTPSMYSMLADYVRPERRGRAFAILAMAIPFSVAAGYILGGLLNEAYGWHMTFIIIGAPGLVVGLLALLTVPEPQRGGIETRGDKGAGAPPFWASLKWLLAKPAYRFTVLAGVAVSIAAYASGVWTPSYIERAHGLSVKDANVLIGPLYATAGITGSLIGGWLADRLATARADDRWYGFLPAIALALAVPCAALAYLSPGLTGACIGFWAMIFLMHWYGGAHAAMLQGLSGLRMRGLSTAFYNFCNNMIAMSLGPLLVGVLSDIFTPQYGPAVVRYALAGVVWFGFALAALFFLLGTRNLRANLADARQA